MALPDHYLPPVTSSRLESLRGLAAIQVAGFHCLMMLVTSASAKASIPPFVFSIFNGPAAVTLFFVLSGLVLGLSMRRSSHRFDYVCGSYALRRIFRIYPAYIVCTLLAFALAVPYHHLPASDSSAMNGSFRFPLTLTELLKNLGFVSVDMNGVTWTLRMELICSVLPPLSYYAGVRSKFLPWLILLAIVIVAHRFSTVTSAGIIQAFQIGYLIPETAPFWRRVETSQVIGVICLMAGVVLLLGPRLIAFSGSNRTLLEALGAALIISSVTYGAKIQAYTFLDRHLTKVAGRISYSYYLLHPLCIFPVTAIALPFLLQVTSEEHPVLCAGVLWILSSAIAFPLAWLSFEWVEKPFILFSKTLFTRTRMSLQPAPTV